MQVRQPEQAEDWIGLELERFHCLGRPPLLQVSYAEPEVRDRTARIELDCLFRLHLRLVHEIGKKAPPRQREVGGRAQWFEHDSAPNQRQSLVGPAEKSREQPCLAHRPRVSG